MEIEPGARANAALFADGGIEHTPIEASEPTRIGAVALLRLLSMQLFARHRLERRPEPDGVMDSEASVADYRSALRTKLAISYAIGYQTIFRAREAGCRRLAVDFCSGPGLFTLGLIEVLGYLRVVGLDAAPAMVRAATHMAHQRSLADAVDFKVADVRHETPVECASADLCTLFDAAHHFDDIDALKSVIREMERVTCADGTLVILDLARLATAELTERYVETIGKDYRRMGLVRFLDDFRDSMFAAWTVEEMRQAIPGDSSRRWVQLVSAGLPALQFLIGLPRGRKRVFVRKANDVKRWVPEPMHDDLRTVRMLFRLSRPRVVHVGEQ